MDYGITMDVETATRVYEKRNGSVIDGVGVGIGGSRHYSAKNVQVCSFWLAGKCNRNPCRFLHTHSPILNPQRDERSHDDNNRSGNHKFKYSWRNPNQSNKLKQCEYWVSGNCVYGDKCKYLHSWYCGSGFTLLTNLEGHKAAITGIALPSGSDKLFSGSKDESVCVWDCHSGQRVNLVNPGSEIGCLISEGPWVFVGLQNAVKAWNIETETELVLNGPNGLVNAMVVGGDGILFAGVQDGTILAWKSNSASGCSELGATLTGHKLAVLSLVVGDQRLYSGSMDGTIRVWDLKTFQCLETLKGHTNSITSLFYWNNFLMSGSLDTTLKVWAATETGKLEEVYEVKKESGILALCGMNDAEAKPILLCSCEDNTVCLYELPSFDEKGKMFSKKQVQTIGIGCDGLIFTGDASGQLSVWKMLQEPNNAGSS